MAVLSNTGIRAGASGVVVEPAEPYNVKRSTRFNDDDSAYLNWTPAAAGNRQSWTWSCWVKKTRDAANGVREVLFGGWSADNNTNWLEVGFDANALYATSNSTANTSDALHRDFSAWQHVVINYNGSHVKFYSNGELMHSGARTGDCGINAAIQHTIGTSPRSGTTDRGFDGYISNVHFIDGSTLAPTDFGFTNSTTGQWVPKEYEGTYGTNGFYLAMDPAYGTIYSEDGAGDIDSSHPWADGFDGDITDMTRVTANGTATWTPSTSIAFTKLRIYGATDGTGDNVIKANGTTLTGIPESGGSAAWVDITSQISSPLTSVQLVSDGANPRFQAIEINDQILIDHGTFGYDSSGNENHWHINNLSATAGAGNDLLSDVPAAPYDNSLNGGGNYATLNPVDSATTLSNGNLTITGSGSAFKGVRSTIGMKTGKWYFEGKQVALSSATSSGFGIWDDTKSTGQLNSGGGSYGNNYLVVYDYAGNLKRCLGGTATTIEAGSISAGDIFGFALDLDNGTLKVHQNGTYLNSGNSIYDTWSSDRTYFFGGYEYESGNTLEFNFGARAFEYTLPTGYKALNTYNLDAPTITDPSKHFDVATDTGANILSTATGLTDGADFVWIKDRANSDDHILFNRINDTGMDGTPHLRSNEPDTEATAGTYSAPSGNSVGWVWNAGTTNVTNDASSTGVGSVDSTYRVNTNTGFSIVSFDSGSSGNQTVAHGLNAVPKLIFTKNRESDNSWVVYHTDGTGTDEYLLLNGNAAAASNTDIWGTSDPTSTVFGFESGANMNADEDIIAYCWSEVAGYSKIGSWVSTGADFIYCGFKPAFLLAKCTSHQGDWMMYDLLRMVQGSDSNILMANSSTYEDDGSPDNYDANQALVDLLSNGFKIRHSGSSPLGDSGRTYIFAAFAESPFKYSNAR